jgi:hypothetical protein
MVKKLLAHFTPRKRGVKGIGNQPPGIGASAHCAPNATGLERGCVQSTSRSTLKSFVASGVFQQADFAKRLRLVFDTAALRGQCVRPPGIEKLISRQPQC